MWEIFYKNVENQGNISLDAEKPIHIDVDDYDFSGRLGLAVWHVDDGMGAYSIYRMSTFSPSSNNFIERSPASRCEDEFINLRVEKNFVLLVFIGIKIFQKMCVTRLSATK